MKTIEEKIAVMKAAAEGKTIEYATLDHKEWNVAPSQALWDWVNFDYRVKPEEPAPKYVPYKSAEEFLAAQKEHGMYIVFNEIGCDGFYDMPISVTPIGVTILLHAIVNDSSSPLEIKYEKLLRCFKWQDGTPCGKLVEE